MSSKKVIRKNGREFCPWCNVDISDINLHDINWKCPSCGKPAQYGSLGESWPGPWGDLDEDSNDNDGWPGE